MAITRTVAYASRATMDSNVKPKLTNVKVIRVSMEANAMT